MGKELSILRVERGIMQCSRFRGSVQLNLFFPVASTKHDRESILESLEGVSIASLPPLRVLERGSWQRVFSSKFMKPQKLKWFCKKLWVRFPDEAFQNLFLLFIIFKLQYMDYLCANKRDLVTNEAEKLIFKKFLSSFLRLDSRHGPPVLKF